MRNNKFSLYVCVIYIISLPVFAAELPQEFVKLEESYKQQLQKIETDTEKETSSLSAKYIENLRSLEATFQKAGKLEPLLAAKQERERFQKNNQLAESDMSADIPELRAIQQKYIDDTKMVPVNRAKKIVDLAEKYDKALLALQEKLTKSGDVEMAVMVKGKRESLQNQPEVTAAKFLLETETPKQTSKETDKTTSAQTISSQTQQKKNPSFMQKQQQEPTSQKYKGSPERRMKDKFEEYFNAMKDNDFEEAAQIVNPETLTRRGLDAVSARLRMFYAAVTLGGNPKIKMEPDDIKIDKDNKTATMTLRARVDNNIFGGPTILWIEKDGDWYVEIDQQPQPQMQHNVPPQGHRR